MSEHDEDAIGGFFDLRADFLMQDATTEQARVDLQSVFAVFRSIYRRSVLPARSLFLQVKFASWTLAEHLPSLVDRTSNMLWNSTSSTALDLTIFHFLL